LYYVQLAASTPCFNDTSGTIVDITEVGITKHSPIDQIKIYPNPTQGEFTVKAESLSAFDILLYDALGKLVYEQKNTANNSVIHAGKLPPGIYEVMLIGAKTLYKQQLLVH
jgi:hypothetical protein